MSKLQPAAKIKLRAYDLIARAVEEGVEYGWRRAHKHTDTPTADHVQEQVYMAVMNAIAEIIDFE